MNGTQALLPDGSGTDDDRLIALLVPPRRPRWKALALTATGLALVVAVVAVGFSGAVVPRMSASLVSADVARDRSVVVVMRINNNSDVAVTVEDFVLDEPSLKGGRVAIPLPVRIGANDSAEVTFTFDDFDCSWLGDGAVDRGLRMRARALLPFSLTRAYDDDSVVLNWRVGTEVEPEVIDGGTFGDPHNLGWYGTALSGACKSASSVGE